MKNFSSLLILISVFLLNVSCNRKVNPVDNTIRVDFLQDATENVKYSTFVDSLYYISLETRDDCLIGRIKDAVLTSEYIFLADEQKQVIWIYDRNGKFLNEISRMGSGPEEYAHIVQFEYDEENAQIAILDWNKSILHYDLKGNFIKKVNLEMLVTDFKILPQGGYIVSKAGEAKLDASIFLTDAEGRVVRNWSKERRSNLLSMSARWSCFRIKIRLH